MGDFFRYVFNFLKSRVFVIMLVSILMLVILVARLFTLQIINGKKFERDFELRIVREVNLKGQRGVIYDRNGTPLAVNQLAYSVQYDYSVYCAQRNQMLLQLIRILNKNGDNLSIDFPIYLDEDGNYRFVDNQYREQRFKKDIFSNDISEQELNYSAKEVMGHLVQDKFGLNKNYKNEAGQETNLLLEEKVNNQELLQLVTIRYALWVKGFYKFIPQQIAVDISAESMAEIEEAKDQLAGVKIVEDSIRKYLYPEYTAHILGYIGKISDQKLKEYEKYGYKNDDFVGRIGIEESMERYLHSVDGMQVVEVDNSGRTRKVVSEIQPTAGKDIYLSMDIDLQIATQKLLVKQLNSIVAQKLVFHRPIRGESRVPELKDVYLSLFRNKTIDINQIVEAPAGSHSAAINDKYQYYLTAKKEQILDSLQNSVLSANQELEKYIDYLLETMTEERMLDSNYKDSSGYVDFSNNSISFKGLLNYFIKENYLKKDKLIDGDLVKWEAMTDNEIYQYFIEQYIEKDIFQRYLLKNLVFLETIEKEQYSYLDLSMLLIEQNIVTVEEETITKLKRGSLSALNFMKELIFDIKLTPNQLALDPSTGGAVIVDVHTGKVLALVSYPSYDNNKISDYQYYQELLKDPTNPLYPTATQGKTAPGSTFKMLSAVAGLEEGVITKNSLVTTKGVFTKIKPPIRCWIADYGGSHGTINVVTAIAVSCNSFFNEVGYRLGITDQGNYDPLYGAKRLAKYAKMFGLNTTTGIELVESKPSTPGGDFSQGVNPAAAAMGQELNSYTPTQMARYIATVANDGSLYKLTLIDRICEPDGTVYQERKPELVEKLDLKEDTLKTVRQGMLEVTTGSRGTARSFYSGFPIEVGGKTGTAQQNTKRASHAVFASYAPAKEPEIALVVELPYSYTKPFSSGYIVGTVAKDIYSAYYNLEYVESPDSYQQQAEYE